MAMNNPGKRKSRRIHRLQFSTKSLLWLMVATASALFGFAAGQRHEYARIRETWSELDEANARVAAEIKAIQRRADEELRIAKEEWKKWRGRGPKARDAGLKP